MEEFNIDAVVKELIEKGPPREVKESKRDLCGACGNLKSGPAEMNESWCRCEVVRRKAMLTLSEIDPDNEMMFSTFEPKTDSQKKASELLKVLDRGIAMFGKPGAGKTHLSVATCRAVFDRGGVFGYYNVTSLVSRIQSSYSGEGFDSRTSIIEEVARRPVVVLDDLGKEHHSTNVDSIVYELVDTLYARKRLLILCSNLPSKDYAERYDEAVRSRIAGMCERLVVEGPDRRRS